jgi:hypothetical protein
MNIYTFDIPEHLNSIQLKTELNAESVYVLENQLYIQGSMTKQECDEALANHVPQPTQSELNTQRKIDILEKLGLTAEEAALLLS